jgi:hypothetical protein
VFRCPSAVGHTDGSAASTKPTLNASRIKGHRKINKGCCWIVTDNERMLPSASISSQKTEHELVNSSFIISHDLFFYRHLSLDRLQIQLRISLRLSTLSVSSVAFSAHKSIGNYAAIID